MSQLIPSPPCSRAATRTPGAQPGPQQPLAEQGTSFSLSNPVLPYRMVSTLGKRRATMPSNDLELDIKEQTSNRRKADEEPGSGEKSKLAPSLTTQGSRTSVL